MIVLKTRKLGRAAWRYLYREYRIARRETTSAALDVMLYGAGFVRIDANGVRHVPFQELFR